MRSPPDSPHPSHGGYEAGINLRSIQTISREGGMSIVAISAERTKGAMALVKDVLISGGYLRTSSHSTFPAAARVSAIFWR